ncbi:MAG: helix-turn-helix transcriptional regulator [Alistipes sp.]|nr:helix-turn-helix transcriptional regulator [Alistipes sp.]
MRTACPKTCVSLQHPEAGFALRKFKAGERFSFKSENQHRIIFLLSGSMKLTSPQTSDYYLESQKFIFCYKEYEYDVEVTTTSEAIIANFAELGAAFDIKTLSRLYNKECEESEYEFGAEDINEALSEYLSMMKRYLRDGIECKHLHYPALQQLFIVFRFYYTTQQLLRLFYNIFDGDSSFKTLVKNNCMKVKTLNELAVACGYDISHFNVLFRKHFKGVTPYVWMQEQRSREVYHCIINTDMPIGEIAKKYGFSNAGHLSTFCRNFLGDTPIKLRNRHKKALLAGGAALKKELHTELY